MIELEIVTIAGRRRRIRVEQAQFIQLCHWKGCQREFRTIDPDKLYCSITHRVRAYQDRQFGNIQDARICLLSTTGLGLSEY